MYLGVLWNKPKAKVAANLLNKRLFDLGKANKIISNSYKLCVVFRFIFVIGTLKFGF